MAPGARARRIGILGPLILLVPLTILLFSGAASAAPTVNIVAYVTANGEYLPVEEGGTIPPGSTLKLRVYVEFNSCGEVRVGWGDGTPSETKNYGGAFVMNWEHVFNREGDFGIVATDCTGSDGASIKVGSGGIGGLGPLSPSSPLFVPSVLGLFFGLLGLQMAASSGAKGGSGTRGLKGTRGPPLPRSAIGQPARHGRVASLPYLASTAAPAPTVTDETAAGTPIVSGGQPIGMTAAILEGPADTPPPPNPPTDPNQRENTPSCPDHPGVSTHPGYDERGVLRWRCPTGDHFPWPRPRLAPLV